MIVLTNGIIKLMFVLPFAAWLLVIISMQLTIRKHTSKNTLNKKKTPPKAALGRTLKAVLLTFAKSTKDVKKYKLHIPVLKVSAAFR